MNIIKTTLTCPNCGKTFDIETEERTQDDRFLEECPMCGSSLEVHLVLDEEGKVVNVETIQVDGDSSD